MGQLVPAGALYCRQPRQVLLQFPLDCKLGVLVCTKSKQPSASRDVPWRHAPFRHEPVIVRNRIELLCLADSCLFALLYRYVQEELRAEVVQKRGSSPLDSALIVQTQCRPQLRRYLETCTDLSRE